MGSWPKAYQFWVEYSEPRSNNWNTNELLAFKTYNDAYKKYLELIIDYRSFLPGGQGAKVRILKGFVDSGFNKKLPMEILEYQEI